MSQPAAKPDAAHFVIIKNDPLFNEQQPRALVPYQDIYGIDEPEEIPWLPETSALLPKGSPHGIVGTSSFYKRNTAPDLTVGGSASLTQMGGDVGKYLDEDIFAVRILSMEPAVHRSYGPGITNSRITGFKNIAGERIRILGEIPLRKFDLNGDPVIDPDGNPDTSFLAKLPADVPFTFQTIDREGMALNISQTWHQLRPGEVRSDCGGCHSHAELPTPFSETAAARSDYPIPDLTKRTPLLTRSAPAEVTAREILNVLDVEFRRDILPIIERACESCHSGTDSAGGYRLDGDPRTLYDQVRGAGSRNSQNVLPFRARLSPLIWKIFGERTDGSGMPLLGDQMPPTEPLTDEERRTFVRWIDIGAPYSSEDDPSIFWETDNWGWFLDTLRPTIALSQPKAGVLNTPLSEIRIGLFDYYSGLDLPTLSITADFSVNGELPGTDRRTDHRSNHPDCHNSCSGADGFSNGRCKRFFLLSV